MKLSEVNNLLGEFIRLFRPQLAAVYGEKMRISDQIAFGHGTASICVSNTQKPEAFATITFSEQMLEQMKGEYEHCVAHGYIQPETEATIDVASILSNLDDTP